jgi:hypothetical protein
MRQPSVEGVGGLKLRRDSSVVNTVGTDPDEVRTEKIFEAEGVFKAGNQELLHIDIRRLSR